MVPVKEAISTGAWLTFSASRYGDPLHFRMRVLFFKKLILSSVDDYKRVEHRADNASWWIMKVEVINLNKKNILGEYVSSTIRLIDQDGFEFQITEDRHLWQRSAFAKSSGLARLAPLENLIPKTKTPGALAFLLPDDDEAIYSIAIYNGTVHEA